MNRKKYKKAYYQANRERLLAYQKEYYESNKEKIRKYRAKYYIENKEHLLEYGRINRFRYSERRRGYRKTQRKKLRDNRPPPPPRPIPTHVNVWDPDLMEYVEKEKKGR